MKRQLDDLSQRLPRESRQLSSSIAVIRKKLLSIEATLVDVRRETPRDVLRYPAALDDTLGELMWSVSMADAAPPRQTQQVTSQVTRRIDTKVRQLNRLVDGPIADLNKKVVKAKVPAIGS